MTDLLSPAELDALRLSLDVAARSVGFSLPLAVLIAWVLTRVRFPGRPVLDAFVHLPLVLPPVAVGYVLLHHGIMGMVDPRAVFNRPEQFHNPWEWAAIHAVFVAAGGVAGVIAWRLNDYHTHAVTPVGIMVLSVIIALLVAVGATFGGSLVFEYGFNVETGGDSPVWHKSETDVFPGHSEGA